jgi:mannose-6-phosphate isomerase-like protein (cupin superfamily)
LPNVGPRAAAVATVRIDEPHVRVTEYRFEPGAKTGWHRHAYDYVVVPLLDGQLLLERPDGSSHTADLKRHIPYERRAGVEHNVINPNAFEFAFLEIELLR